MKTTLHFSARIVLIIHLFLFAQVLYSATIYVNSSTGNDATGNGTSGNPYKTFHKGYTMASAGDILDLTGTFTWTDADETGDAATSGYTISKNITIQGQGAGNTFVQAATGYNTASRRIFTIGYGYSVTLNSLSIRYGKCTDGGGIQIDGSASMDACEVSNNIATSAGGSGGGINVRGTLTIRNSTIHDNTAYYQGGGIDRNYYSGNNGTPSTSDLLTIISCTITLNTVTATAGYLSGGGVYFRRGYGSITNSTITQNQVTGSATASTHGLGCDDNSSTNLTFVYLKNNIIVDNFKTGSPNYGGDVGTSTTNTCFADNGYNVIRKISQTAYDGFSSFATTSWIDEIGISVYPDGNYVLQNGLGTTTGNINISATLANNGTNNFTQTYAILENSLAINRGGSGSNETIPVPETDQRGYGRNGNVDIGAYEYSGIIPTTWIGGGASTSDWNLAENWDKGTVPNAGYNVTIPNIATYMPEILSPNDASNPAICHNLTIEDQANIKIKPGKALTVNGTLTVNNSLGLYLESDGTGQGSLIHNTDNVPAILETYLTGSSDLEAGKYHLVSIPANVTNPTSDIFLDLYLYLLDPTVQNVNNNNYYGVWEGLGISTSTPLSIHNGYMVYYPGASTYYTLIDNLNNGDFSCDVTGHTGTYTFNLVPNPYPSPVNWGVSTGWTKSAGIGGTCYVWNSATGNYTSLVSTSDNYIPISQSFIVMVYNEDSPSLTVNNSARTHSTQSFYKSGDIMQNTLTVNAQCNNYADLTTIIFSPDATNGFDLQTDGIKLYGLSEAPQLYTTLDDQNYSINNLPVYTEQKIVPMNFETQFTGEVTLTFSNIESFETSLNIYLQDLISNKTINLRNQPVYTFSHSPENPANRFNLVFGGTIGINETAPQTADIWISGNTLYINTPEKSGQSALFEVFDVSGKILTTSTITLNELTTIELKQKGLILVRLTTGEDVWTTKGILMK